MLRLVVVVRGPVLRLATSAASSMPRSERRYQRRPAPDRNRSCSPSRPTRAGRAAAPRPRLGPRPGGPGRRWRGRPPGTPDPGPACPWAAAPRPGSRWPCLHPTDVSGRRNSAEVASFGGDGHQEGVASAIELRARSASLLRAGPARPAAAHSRIKRRRNPMDKAFPRAGTMDPMTGAALAGCRPQASVTAWSSTASCNRRYRLDVRRRRSRRPRARSAHGAGARAQRVTA